MTNRRMGKTGAEVENSIIEKLIVKTNEILLSSFSLFSLSQISFRFYVYFILVSFSLSLSPSQFLISHFIFFLLLFLSQKQIFSFVSRILLLVIFLLYFLFLSRECLSFFLFFLFFFFF